MYQVFQTRYSLFKKVYTHKTAKAIELMLVDAMVKADSVFRIGEAVEDPELYVQLNDAIIPRIQFSKEPVSPSSARVVCNAPVRLA